MGMLVPARSAIHFDAQYKGMDIEGYCKILLMEEILHHLGCIKPFKKTGYLPYQLGQDFFHQPYDATCILAASLHCIA